MVHTFELAEKGETCLNDRCEPVTRSAIHYPESWEFAISPGKGSGAFPFRTGICAVRVAIVDIFNNIRTKISSAAEA